jgi:hypothetical protein
MCWWRKLWLGLKSWFWRNGFGERLCEIWEELRLASELYAEGEGEGEAYFLERCPDCCFFEVILANKSPGLRYNVLYRWQKLDCRTEILLQVHESLCLRVELELALYLYT